MLKMRDAEKKNDVGINFSCNRNIFSMSWNNRSKKEEKIWTIPTHTHKLTFDFQMLFFFMKFIWQMIQLFTLLKYISYVYYNKITKKYTILLNTLLFFKQIIILYGNYRQCLICEQHSSNMHRLATFTIDSHLYIHFLDIHFFPLLFVKHV